MNKPDDLWQKKKSNLLESIDEAMEEGSVDKDILEAMRRLLGNVKVKNSMEDYFDENK